MTTATTVTVISRPTTTMRVKAIGFQLFMALFAVYGLHALGTWTARMVTLGMPGDVAVGVLGIVALACLAPLVFSDLVRHRPSVTSEDGGVALRPGPVLLGAQRVGVIALMLCFTLAALLQYRGELVYTVEDRGDRRLLAWLPILGALSLFGLIYLFAKWAKGQRLFGLPLRLTPEGIAGFGQRGQGEVAWSELEGVHVANASARGWGIGPLTAMFTDHRGGVARVQLSGLLGAELTAAAIGFYLRHPERRGELADGSAADRIANRDFTIGR